MADMKRNSKKLTSAPEANKAHLANLEKQLLNKFKLTSVEAERVVIEVQRLLKAKTAPPIQPLAPAEAKVIKNLLCYLKENYPISDAMGYHISQYAADLFFPPKAA